MHKNSKWSVKSFSGGILPMHHHPRGEIVWVCYNSSCFYAVYHVSSSYLDQPPEKTTWKGRNRESEWNICETKCWENSEYNQWRTGDIIWLITYISYLFNPFGATITKPPPFLQPFYRSRMPSKLCPKGQGDGGFNTLLACPNFTTIHAVLHTYAVLPSDSGGRSTEPTSF